jgi:predicted O-methyltransferase YrrM
MTRARRNPPVDRVSAANGDASCIENVEDINLQVAVTRDALNHAIKNFSQIDLDEFQVPKSVSSWCLDFDTLRLVVALIRCQEPQHILEMGSGLSTRVLLQASQLLKHPSQISSVDHDPDFIKETRSTISADLAERLGLQLAPLVIRKFGEDFLPTYRIDPGKFASRSPVDLCLIDGPPIGLGGREGTLYQVLPFCRPGTCVLLDDATRENERKVLEKWSKCLGDAIEVRDLEGFKKGLAAVIVHKPVHPDQLWQHMLEMAASELDDKIPAGARVLVIDQHQWPDQFSSLVAFPIEKITSFSPAETSDVIDALRRSTSSGVEFVAFAWPAFWWFDHFAGLQTFLDLHAHQILSTKRVVAYDLRCLEDEAGSSPSTFPSAER